MAITCPFPSHVRPHLACQLTALPPTLLPGLVLVSTSFAPGFPCPGRDWVPRVGLSGVAVDSLDSNLASAHTAQTSPLPSWCVSFPPFHKAGKSPSPNRL